MNSEQEPNGPNQLFRVGNVISVEEGGVRFNFGDVMGGEPVRSQRDARFTRDTLQPQDIIVMTSPARRPGIITTVFREGLQVFPPHEDTDMQTAVETAAREMRTRRLGVTPPGRG